MCMYSSSSSTTTNQNIAQTTIIISFSPHPLDTPLLLLLLQYPDCIDSLGGDLHCCIAATIVVHLYCVLIFCFVRVDRFVKIVRGSVEMERKNVEVCLSVGVWLTEVYPVSYEANHWQCQPESPNKTRHHMVACCDALWEIQYWRSLLRTRNRTAA